MNNQKNKKEVQSFVFHDELDSETFCCHRCKGYFSHIDGTWLPIGIRPAPKYMTILPEGTDPRFPTTPVAYFSLQPPEIITSDDFTCYDCLTEDDVQNELLRQCKRAECDDYQTDLINENTITIFNLNKQKYLTRLMHVK